MKPVPLAGGLWAAGVGLVLRLAVAIWGASRFPASEDGRLYEVLASRLAAGHGYSWQWPDGVVTSVAHYPVGYPALVAAAYALVGRHLVGVMVLQALLGAAAVLAVHRVAVVGATRGGALLAAWLVALHPALVLYTPAIMTEGVTAALLALCAWGCVAAARAKRGTIAWIAVGIGFGGLVLLRPQCLLFAPVFPWALAPNRRVAMLRGAGVTAVALACVLPWSWRNCQRMDACSFVSANAGWNLWIGVPPHATGSFVPVAGDTVPLACREVFAEVAKDKCFAAAAVQQVKTAPAAWLTLIPDKLSYTFDYCGAAGWYLHAANPQAFPERAKWFWGSVETIYQRGLLALALLGLARASGWRRKDSTGDGARRCDARTQLWTRALVLVGLVALLTPWAWVTYLTLASAAVLQRGAWRDPSLLFAGVTLLGTALTHAVFFGAGRYSLVTFAVVAPLCGRLLTAAAGAGDTVVSEENLTDAPD
ncbi:MAG: glycosyltransferase family 39 protein [Polyangiaceae bacterium]